jgi:8-oxo-dGTP pyrophosphatase MutT (NUDIX family)
MSLLIEFDQILGVVLEAEFEGDFTAAVAIIQERDRWLLGLARSTGDDRSGKWCHPGGGIRPHESPEKAAVREAWEETGIRCKAIGDAFRDSRHKNVAFVHCRTTTTRQKINVNHEFSAAGFFTLPELRTLKPLYKNARDLIDKVKRRR